MPGSSVPRIAREDVVNLWLHRQGLSTPRGTVALNQESFVEHLERAGGLQVDSVNVVDRAHSLTLWSRFGPFDRPEVDRCVYTDCVAYEYWGHAASILPVSNLPLGLRRMRRFPPKKTTGQAWWEVYRTSAASKRRVLKRLREEGPLESADFEGGADDAAGGRHAGGAPRPAEDKRSLKLLWHAGRIAVSTRRHFRCVYDLAERVYPEAEPATPTEYEDAWLLTGLRGQGIASERHLANYWTAPNPDAAGRKRILARNLKNGRIVEVRVEGHRGPWYALPEDLDAAAAAPEAVGTTLVCPFDSLLWQRARAEDLLDFSYRIEIYVPAAKRQYGYYVMPILDDGRLVGRLDPKLHRDRGVLEVKSIHTEEGFARDRRFDRALVAAVESLAEHVGADAVEMPRDGHG